MCHRIGSLLPKEGKRPEYSKFHPNEQIVADLIQMFDAHIPIVQLFRTACDRLSESNDDRFCIRLFGTPDNHGDVFNAPVASEVVGLVVGDLGASESGRDLLIEDKEGHLKKIDEKHCKFMAMQ